MNIERYIYVNKCKDITGFGGYQQGGDKIEDDRSREPKGNRKI